MSDSEAKDPFEVFNAKKVTILVMFLGPKDIFLHGFCGNLSGIDLIEEELKDEDNESFFKNGEGEYIFECSYDSGQFGEYGRCEIPPYWELCEKAFKPIKEST